MDDLEFAVANGIRLTTFDTASELEKIAQHAPSIDCLLRIKVDNPSARVQLGLKYGADASERRPLVDYARELGVNVVGTAFHVGSASADAEVFEGALADSRAVFDYARSRGFLMRTLDVGGGFTASNFVDCARVIRRSLGRHFQGTSADVIAEPGRFFAEKVYTFFVPVMGGRIRGGTPEYYVGDSLYGSMNCVVYDGQTPTFDVLRDDHDERSTDETYSVIHFATCDSYDTLPNKVRLPRGLRTGDFLSVPDFGAYTLAGACDFNGINFANPRIFYR